MGVILLSCIAYTKDLHFICITCVTHAEVSQRYVSHAVTDSKQDHLFPWYNYLINLPYLPGSETQPFVIYMNCRAGVSINKH